MKILPSIAAFFLMIMSCLPASAAPPLVFSDTGDAVPASYLHPALTQGGVIATLQAGEHIHPLGLAIEAKNIATLYLSLSSQFLSVACLKGEVSHSQFKARSGEVIVHDYSTKNTDLYAFDIERFLGSTSLVIDRSLRQSLRNTARSQRYKKFFGLLEPVYINAQAPVSPMVEASARDMLLHETIVSLRQQTEGDQRRLSYETAFRFAEALHRRDTDILSALLHPLPFSLSEDKNAEWLSTRHAFATKLAESSLPYKIRDARLREGTDIDEYVLLLKNGNQFIITLEPYDDMVFVTGFKEAK
jgi:hypothetical protein